MEKQKSMSVYRYAILWAVLIGNIIGPIDGSMINVVLPTLSDAFLERYNFLTVKTFLKQYVFYLYTTVSKETDSQSRQASSWLNRG